MRTAVLAGLVAMLLLPACEETRDRTAANVVERIFERKGREASVEIDREEGSIRIELGGAIVPVGWPRDVPVPPGARRLRIQESTADRTILLVAAEEDADELERWYGRELRAAGWQVEPLEGGGLRAGKDERRLAAAFSRRGDQSRGRIELGSGLEKKGG